LSGLPEACAVTPENVNLAETAAFDSPFQNVVAATRVPMQAGIELVELAGPASL